MLSEATFKALSTQVAAVALGAQRVKGRDAPVFAYKINRVGER